MVYRIEEKNERFRLQWREEDSKRWHSSIWLNSLKEAKSYLAQAQSPSKYYYIDDNGNTVIHNET